MKQVEKVGRIIKKNCLGIRVLYHTGDLKLSQLGVLLKDTGGRPHPCGCTLLRPEARQSLFIWINKSHSQKKKYSFWWTFPSRVTDSLDWVSFFITVRDIKNAHYFRYYGSVSWLDVIFAVISVIAAVSLFLFVRAAFRVSSFLHLYSLCYLFSLGVPRFVNIFGFLF